MTPQWTEAMPDDAEFHVAVGGTWMTLWCDRCGQRVLASRVAGLMDWLLAAQAHYEEACGR